MTGLYRYVRNPMYVAILWMLIGQALLMGNPALAGYATLVWLGFHLWVLAYEEPTLRKKFGADYAAYRARVRRWWPRLEALVASSVGMSAFAAWSRWRCSRGCDQRTSAAGRRAPSAV